MIETNSSLIVVTGALFYAPVQGRDTGRGDPTQNPTSPLPAYTITTEPGESEIASDAEEDWTFPPTPTAVCLAGTADTYMHMV